MKRLERENSWIGILDCNNFYASCERVFRPDLKGKPVAILSNNDGCIVARSQEVKALGIPNAVPIHQIAHLIKQHQIHVLSSNYELYADMHRRIMQTLQCFFSGVEVYSIDEAFLDFFPINDAEEAEAFAHKVKNTVETWTKIPVSIGIARTKTLAKVANKWAKEYRHKTEGVVMVSNEQKRANLLKNTDISSLWGVGYGHRDKLRNLNIDNAWALSQQSYTWARKLMTVQGERLVRELNNEPCYDVESELKAKKILITGRSFRRDITDWATLEGKLSGFCADNAARLREQGKLASVVSIYMSTNKFNAQIKLFRESMSITLPKPTSDTHSLLQYTLALAKKMLSSTSHFPPIKKATVTFYDMAYTDERQLGLFEGIKDETSSKVKAGIRSMHKKIKPKTTSELPQVTNESTRKHNKLSATLDKINQKMGKGKITWAKEDPQAMISHQERLSPRYTTRTDELPKLG